MARKQADKPPPRDEIRCEAINKTTGTRCRNTKVKGEPYCLWHGSRGKAVQRAGAYKRNLTVNLQRRAQDELGLYQLADIPRICAWMISKLRRESFDRESEYQRSVTDYLRTASDALKALGETGAAVHLYFSADQMPKPIGPRPDVIDVEPEQGETDNS